VNTSMWIRQLSTFVSGAVLLMLASAAAPADSPQAGPLQTASGWNGVFPPTVADDNGGFVPIFDGKSLNGWDGDMQFWRAENGEIIGETTAEKVVKQNNFLIWRGGTVRDFELKLEFRINGTNSGVQYRSTELPNVGKWVLKGYQADIDFGGLYAGNIHDERRRGPTSGGAVLSRRGQVTRVTDGPVFKIVGTIADPTLLRGVLNVNDWNRYHIIGRGSVLMQFINTQLMSIVLDEDSKNFSAEGVIGFQMHTGPPFKIQYRNVLLRKL
jgi:hypothetical protein